MASFHTHSFLDPIFGIPPTFLLMFISISHLTLLRIRLPCSQSLMREGAREWDQASVFHTVGHDTLVGREINLVGH